MFDCEVTAIILKRDYEHKMYYTILTNECLGFSKRQRFYLFIAIIIICIGVCVCTWGYMLRSEVNLRTHFVFLRQGLSHWL